MAQPYQLSIALAAAQATAVSASQSPGAGAILINGLRATSGVATLDSPRRVLFTSGGDDSGITFTVTGTDRSGNPLGETIAGANGTAYTTQDFKTVTGVTHTGSVASTLTIGTNGIASSQWCSINYQIPQIEIGFVVTVSGTINYSVEYTYDNPSSPFSGTFPTVFQSSITSQSTNKDGTINDPVYAVRVTQNSFTSPGSLKAIIIQSGLA